MARRPRVLAPQVFYHVIVRGNHRYVTFRTPSDYQAYLERLARYLQHCWVRLWGYCLMPNHVHLLAETAHDPLSSFMHRLLQSYTQYFNRTHRTVGHVFQGRYKAIVCEKDRYLLALIRYILLNPVRAKLVEQPDAYPCSGHVAYLTGHATVGSCAWSGNIRRPTGVSAVWHQADCYAVTVSGSSAWTALLHSCRPA